MEVKIVHEVQFGKDGILDDLIHDFLEGLIITSNNNSKLIIQKLDQIMATLKQFQDAFGVIDTATSQIATSLAGVANRMSGLEERIKQLGLDSSVEEEILGRIKGVGQNLEQTAAALDQMAKDPSNPVPIDPGTSTTTTTTAAPEETTTTAPVEETKTTFPG